MVPNSLSREPRKPIHFVSSSQPTSPSCVKPIEFTRLSCRLSVLCPCPCPCPELWLWPAPCPSPCSAPCPCPASCPFRCSQAPQSSSWPWPACSWAPPWPLSSASFSSTPKSSSANFCRSCAWMFDSSQRSTLECTVGRILAKLLMERRRLFTVPATSLLTRSSLLRRILSAKATCWYASFTFPSSTSSSRRARMCFASTTVTTPSRRSSSVRSLDVMKVLAIGTGSAMPVVSIRIASSRLPWRFTFMSCLRPLSRSPRTVQHMQPLSMTTTSSARANLSIFRRSSSIGTSPNSFSMTATLLSRCSCRM
mmetsp:Transcript_15316/g.45957  ORF Transcript_15316/g.45957 Transcript_15316/m.45957 type:complete len:309 (-) Transcript_15316:392-1318(-)